jgi:hypothetical protein
MCAWGAAAAGWMMVRNSQVQDGHADLSYMGDDHLDPGWAPPARNAWSLRPNLEWLAGFTDPGAPAPPRGP